MKLPSVLCGLCLVVSFQSIRAISITDRTSGLSAMQTNFTISKPVFASKPVRGVRGGGTSRGTDYEGKVLERGSCDEVMVADSSSKKNQLCPDECPFYAQDRSDDRHCTFRCVTGDMCAHWNPNKPIPDHDMGVCRSPMVEFCNLPATDGSEVCLKCMGGYALHSDGQCYYKYKFVIYIVVAVLALIVVALVCWIVDLACRPTHNDAGLTEGLKARERSKVQMRADHLHPDAHPDTHTHAHPDLQRQQHATVARHGFGGQMSPRLARQWPLDPRKTNLCVEDVAGPGMTLHFNFQVAIIVWALMMASGWALLAFIVDSNLFILGTRKFGTPRDNCILVAWGYETQKRLMWTKVLYLWVAYLSSFALTILHGIRQLRIYERLDNEYKTMRDFAVLVSGMPELDGTKLVEESLKDQLKVKLGIEVVGVSVAWNFKDDEDMVAKVTKHELKKFAEARHPIVPTEDHAEEEFGYIRKTLNEFECSYLVSDEGEASPDADILTLLKKMKTSPDAFIVFDTEAARDDAMDKINDVKQNFQFEGNTLKAKIPQCEPVTVQWPNFDGSGAAKKTARLIKGVGYILLALTMWICCFYAPYAWSVFNFNYDNGMEPGPIYSISFSMVVCIGNVIMYAVCAIVSEMVRFRFGDDKEALYLILYAVSCTLNILMDLISTYFMSWSIMTGLGFRTYDGRRLEELNMFPEGFETYAMQRNLAESTFAYAWPSTYLIPFLIEPIATITVPLYVGKLLVRSHKRVRGADAEDVLAGPPMDLGRYGDILLNVIIFIFILFFPGGYTARLGFYFALAHMYIYAFDTYKVLRVIPNVTYASFVVDWWSQAMLAPCCGLILSILVFKGNNHEGGAQMGVMDTIVACSSAFVLHVIVHMFILIKIVPKFGIDKEDIDDDVTFAHVAATCPDTWFNTNPVHCLRSKFVYKHNPPCIFSANGKKQLLEINESIGCYYSEPGRTSSKKP